MDKKNVHLQVMITQDMNERLQKRARRDGMSVPEVVRAILAVSNLRSYAQEAEARRGDIPHE